MVKNSKFLELVSSDKQEYIGMGNPDSSLLLVGSEKALDNQKHQGIIHHELHHNWSHWADIVNHHSHLVDPYDIVLLKRGGDLVDFNPFNPLFLAETRSIVLPLGGHTYKKIKGLINSPYKKAIHDLNPLTTPFAINVFSKCFITELSADPALNQNTAKFNLKNFISSSRYDFMRYGDAGFYKGFKTVLLYFGKNDKYIGTVGSAERLAILKIFDPEIDHQHIKTVKIDGFEFVYYQRSNNVRILLSYHMVARPFTNVYRKALSSLIIS